METPATDLATLIRQLRSGQLTSEALTRQYLARIDAHDGQLRAYERVDAPRALQQARAMDALLAAGTDLGPLMGLPVAVKDVLNVAGMPARAGSEFDLSAVVGTRESSFVTRLRQAGCVILGKTRTAEFALSSSGVNFRNGTPRNPWDASVARVPGGSSSGSAVAAAANLCAFAIGTDTGGSVRTPAAFCGVVGVKFSAGRFPMDGAFPLSTTLDSLGIFTHSAACAGLVCDVLYEAPGGAPPAGPLRLGMLDTYLSLDTEPGILECWDAALARLRAAGHQIETVDTSGWRTELNELYQTITRPEVLATLAPLNYEAGRDLINPDIFPKIESGKPARAMDYIAALRRREAVIEQSLPLFQRYDALISPTKPAVAPPIPASYTTPEEDARLLSKTGTLTREGNVLNLTGVSLPIHQLTGLRLPAGLMVLGPRHADQRIVALACALESVLGLGPQPELEAFRRP